MPKHLKTLSLLLLMVMPLILLAQPVSTARAQVQYQQSFSGITLSGEYNYTAIAVNSASIVGYATKTDISVDTAFMTAEQLNAFSAGGDITNSIFYQQGTENYDALLEVPGTYYLVVYNPNGQTANLNALYIVDPNINLRNSSTTVGLTIQLQPGELFTLPLHVETLGSPSQVDIVGASSQIVRYALLDNSTQTPVYESPDVTITNFTAIPTVSIGYNFTLSPGMYVMGIRNDSPNTALVYFSYNIIPAYVNPFILHFGPPSPTGIAAYGLDNNSGTVTPYKITTDSIVGFATINKLTAMDNGSGLPLASLQENTVLQVNNTDGSSFTYWPQNVLAFNTSAPSVTYRDNVLNLTGDNAQLTNSSIVGTGTTGGIINGGIPQTYYGNYNSNYTYPYSLPQSWVLYTNETVEQGTGVLIQMGVRALNGPTPDKVTWFDRITVEDPNVASAAFVVDGKSYTPAGVETPIGTYYDAELVFGGGAGGMAAQFQLNAKLALFYEGPQTLQPFPSLYTFGDDTAEAAFNINVANGNGAAVATDGTPYFGILSNNFNASLSSLVAHAPSSSGFSGSAGDIIGAAVIAAIVVIALVVVMRRRASHPEQVLIPPMEQTAARFCGNCGAPLDPNVRFCPSCGTEQQPEAPPPPPPDGI